MNLHSRINPTQTLHIITRKRDIEQGRKDIVEPDCMLQCAVMKYSNGQTFKPHKHISKWVPDIDLMAKESWVIIKGLVKVTLYDIDDSILHTDILEQGDISITVGEAGHNYLIMSDDAIIAEFKSGPYLGVDNDKIFI